MIRQVRLVNWKSHLGSVLKFSEGTNAMVGSMGSGKSSILQAICFGLFGDLPEMRQRKVKLDDLIMRKPIPKGFAEVEVEFECDGRAYAVKRRIERGKGTTLAEIREGGRLVETNGSKVTAVVEKILKVDYELFALVVYSEQNQLDYFLTVPKGKRMERMDSLLRMDRLEEARKSAISLISEFGIRISEKESYLRGFDSEGKRREFEKLTGEMAELEVKRKTLASELEGLKSKLDCEKKKEAELEAKEAKKNELEKEEHLLKSRLLETKSSAASLKAIIPATENMPEEPDKALVAAGEELKGAVEAEREAARLEQRLGEVEGALEQLSSRKLELICALGEEYSKKTVDLIGNEVNEHSSKIAEKKRLLSGLEIAIEESRSGLLELERRLAVASRSADELKRLSLELEEKRKAASGLDKASLDYSALSSNLERLGSEMGKLEAHISHLSGDVEQLGSSSGRCPLCESPLEPCRQATLLSDKRSRLAEASARMEALKKEADGAKTWKNSAESELLKLRRISEECLSLAKRIDALSRPELLVEKTEAEIASETGKKAEIEKRRLGLASELEELEKAGWALSSILDRRKMLSSTESGILEHEGKARTFRELIEPLKKKAAGRDKLEKNLELLENALELIRLEKVASETQTRLAEIAREISGLAFMPQELRETRSGLNSLLGMLGTKQAEFDSLPVLMAEKKRLSYSISSELSKAEEYGRELKLLKGVLDDCRILQNALRETQLALRVEFVSAINDFMGEGWSAIYPYGDFSGVRFMIEQEGTAKGDYSLQLRERDGWVDVEGLASGGERSLACLALRIAMARVLVPNLRWLVLDEPTHNLDDQGIAELAIALRERVVDIIDQVLLITHEERLEPAVTGYCYKLERDKARDEPTKVNLIIGGNGPVSTAG